MSRFRCLASSLFLMLACSGADWTDHPENRWVLRSPTPVAPAPHFGWEGGGDFDPIHRLWMHHAGHDGVPQGFHLFTFDPANGRWEQRFPNTSPPGACCVDGAHVYDIAHERYVRFPGASLGHGYQWSRGVKLKNSPVWLYDYKYVVFAYIVRAVNRLGVESGPSPYALTIPCEPANVFNREAGGAANLDWSPNPERGIQGYRIYKLEGVWNIVSLTPEPIKATSFRHVANGQLTRYWITAVDGLGQEGQPSSPVWHMRSYQGFFQGDRHQ